MDFIIILSKVVLFGTVILLLIPWIGHLGARYVDWVNKIMEREE